jgi:hypothetical protein
MSRADELKGDAKEAALQAAMAKLTDECRMCVMGGDIGACFPSRFTCNDDDTTELVRRVFCPTAEVGTHCTPCRSLDPFKVVSLI